MLGIGVFTTSHDNLWAANMDRLDPAFTWMKNTLVCNILIANEDWDLAPASAAANQSIRGE